jgi:hypothetical protein
MTDLLVSTGSLLVVAVIMFFLGYDAGRWSVKRQMERAAEPRSRGIAEKEDIGKAREPWGD